MKNGKWKIATPTFCCSLTERHPFTPSSFIAGNRKPGKGIDYQDCQPGFNQAKFAGIKSGERYA
jgi:hypothetical protein